MGSRHDPRRRQAATRRSALAALATAGAGSLCGCSAVEGVFGGTDRGTIELEYVDVADERSRETFDPVVEVLNERHDATVELSVEELPYGELLGALQRRVGGGDPPDVAAIDQIWLGRFVDGDALLPLGAVVDDVDLEDFLDPFVEAARFGDRHYALPITTDVRGMYWNREAFREVGLDPDAPPQTWAELLDAAEALHDPPERVGATMFVNGGRFTVPLFAAGGDVLGEDGTEPRFHEAPGRRAADFVDRLFNERGVGPRQPPADDGAATAREFLQGHAGITVVEGSWLDYHWRSLGRDTDSFTERFGFAPTPAPADGAPATMSGGFMWAGFADTDHPAVVRDFLRAATSREFLRHLAVDARQIPTRESLLEDDAVWDAVLHGDEVRELLADTRLRPVRNWNVVATELDPALERVAHGEADPADALADAAERVRAELR